jgi:hypothetical protein
MYGGLNIAHMTFRLGKAGLIIMLVAHVKAHTQRHTETHTHTFIWDFMNILMYCCLRMCSSYVFYHFGSLGFYMVLLLDGFNIRCLEKTKYQNPYINPM